MFTDINTLPSRLHTDATEEDGTQLAAAARLKRVILAFFFFFKEICFTVTGAIGGLSRNQRIPGYVDAAVK